MIERLAKSQTILSDGITVTRKEIKANSVSNIHWHDFIELEYIVCGKGKNIYDGKEYELKKNTLFFATPINFHEMIYEEDTVLINITLSETICKHSEIFLFASVNSENAITFSEDDAVFVEKLIFELMEAVERRNREYYTVLLDALLIKTKQLLKKKNIAATGYAQTAMLYIINNFRTNISLSSVAEHVGLTPTYLSAIFAKETGINFKEYLNSMRFEYAKKLLKYSGMSISEVSYEIGFEDYSNFLRGFKARFGISPGKYRKNEKIKKEN